MAEGRKWRAGIHQAVEAKQGVEITFATDQAARITVQDFFLRYDRLAGMTGTASTRAGELRKIYSCRVVAGPDQPAADSPEAADPRLRHRRGQVARHRRRHLEQHAAGPARAHRHALDRQEAKCSRRLLAERGIEHQVLNAHHVAHEAEIVARAGQTGKVTVATNMAGRGTDIRLGEGVPNSAACT